MQQYVLNTNLSAGILQATVAVEEKLVHKTQRLLVS